MRSWIFGNKGGGDAPKDDGSAAAATTPPSESSPSRGEGTTGFFQSITRRQGIQDAELERRVSLAARNVGSGVQEIVMAAKGESGVEWKSHLLGLLGGPDNELKECDLDVLIASQGCDKFVLRCLENDLPTNMIHCLRLLRVLELQNATERNRENPTAKVEPISSAATAKVSKLLSRLCQDESVGEQLQPNLFGLLALSGASYPPSGVHVAKAASQAIISFSESCLSTSLVHFLHDRKMIIHMIDDIKELCNASPESKHNPLSCYGDAAEEHGLWAISLSTVVHLVVNSCDHDSFDLYQDFVSVNGGELLKNCIMQSKSKHGKKLMELVPVLACCHVKDSKLKDPNQSRDLKHKKALNSDAYEIMEELLYKSVPMLQIYESEFGSKPDVSTEAKIRELVEYSLNYAIKSRFTYFNGSAAIDPPEFDLKADILLGCIQLYSEHPENYRLLEQQTNFLTLYMLAFPTFADENTKILILKTVEFVVTSVPAENAIQPPIIVGEVFYEMCKWMLENSGVSEDEKVLAILSGFLSDSKIICDTFERLFQGESKASPVLLHDGAVAIKLGAVMELLSNQTTRSKDAWTTTFKDGGKTFSIPPSTTPIDNVCSVVCRVWALVMGQQTRISSKIIDQSSTVGNGVEENQQANDFLVLAAKELGDEAAISSLRVFKSIMSSRPALGSLKNDMENFLKIIDHFGEIVARLCGVPELARRQSTKRGMKKVTSTSSTTSSDTEFIPKQDVDPRVLHRICAIFGIIKDVLETSSLARDAFRISGGFESMIRTLLCMGGIASGKTQNGEGGIFDDIFHIVETILGAVDAATGLASREAKGWHDVMVDAQLPVTISAEALVDPISTQHSRPLSSEQNKYYLRLKGFYLDLSIAISRTGILEVSENAMKMMDTALAHMDQSCSISKIETDKTIKLQTLRNPDAVRFVLGLATFFPDTEDGQIMAKRAFDQVIRLCDPTKAGSTLPQIASCGLVWTLTNPREFSPLLDDTTHHLHTRFVLLLRRIAAYSMSYSDFVAALRCIAGPLLKDENSDSRIRLPVISSSVRQRIPASTINFDSAEWKEKDADACRRLESLCTVAERGDRVARVVLGGDSINTISVLLHKTKVEERLYKASDSGRLNFLEVESIDSSALKPGGFLSAGTAAPGSSGGERIWSPVANSGFSYSIWMRYPKPADETREGNIYILDVSSPSASAAPGAQGAVFLSVWYDLQAQRFNVLSSSSYRGEPTCFPVSPLCPNVWHHVLLTYTPTKRTMMGRKSVFVIYVDGRPLEAEIKVESVNLPPNSKVLIGAPNPAVAVSGVVRGMLPLWDLGPTLMLSTVLMDLDATAMFIFGPDFEGIFWGDRPQRLSLSSTGTAAFSLLAETGEPGSVASALRRREIARLEAAGTVSREMGLGGPGDEDNDSLASLGLLCTIQPDFIVFAYRASSCKDKARNNPDALSHGKKHSPAHRFINMARANTGNEAVSTDAVVYGKAGVVTPRCFADNVQWAGGPEILMPIVNAATSGSSLALAMRLIRASTDRHPPNLEAMQGGGGFQMLAVLLQGKGCVDHSVIDQSFAFAVHGFVPDASDKAPEDSRHRIPPILHPDSDFWVFSDLDAMKQLLLNHQVWDLKNSGPDLPLRFLSYLNGLVGQKSIHKAFNSRRLHLVGIVRWTLHLMIEAAELYTAGEIAMQSRSRSRAMSEDNDDFEQEGTSKVPASADSAYSHGWYSEAPNIDAVAVGGDPDNPLLQACKTLLRRVLTFMLTPGDLDAIAETTMYTVCVGNSGVKTKLGEKQKWNGAAPEVESLEGERLLPGPVARIYLLRLIEELVVDGVNEIVASADVRRDGDPSRVEVSVQPHAGGIANPNQTYLATAMLGGRRQDGTMHPKHQQAQNFLSAFGSVLSPVWFAALLEGCHEEATASAVLRLMILMLQSSPSFAAGFEAAGGFAPLILSIPKFSTCSSIIIALLSELLHVSVLHLPCLPYLDSSQLNEVFDADSDLSEIMSRAYLRSNESRRTDPSCGVFALISECIGRNVQLAPLDTELGRKAQQTNSAVLELLSHCHHVSLAFQDYCRTPDFLEPLAQLLCLVHDERSQRLGKEDTGDPSDTSVSSEDEGKRASRRGSLNNSPDPRTATERFVGTAEEGAGVGLVQLLRLIISHAVISGPFASSLVHSLFRSFPIHASLEQVEGYHLVLLELCTTVVKDAIELGEPLALASSVGVCSVLLDRLMGGSFSSEGTLQTVKNIILMLKSLTSSDSDVARSLSGTAELAMIACDTAHIARLTCLAALRRSRPLTPEDAGDPRLQELVLQEIADNIQALMIVPKSGGLRKAPQGGIHNAPPPNSKLYPIWCAASVPRNLSAWSDVLYPDLSQTEEPLKIFVVGLMVEIQILLRDPRDLIRENAITIVVALIQQRRGIMSGILIKEIQQGDRVETIDVMNRGGFGALLVAHEAAISSGSSSKKSYAPFFEWFERHQAQVQLVFDGIQAETRRVFPGLEMGAPTTAEAVENDQKFMVMRLANFEMSDRTIIGGLERAEVSARCIDRTVESHIHWKRQGFDDLASGAMQWKFLLRRLKGSCSIWEGGVRHENRSMHSRLRQLYSGLHFDESDTIVFAADDEDESRPELVTRWKLDLSEGTERQRRRLLPNYEFHGLYNLDEDADQEEADDAYGEEEDNEGAVAGGEHKRSSSRQSELFTGSAMMHDSHHQKRHSDFFAGSSSMDVTAELLKELNIKTVHRSETEIEDEEDAEEPDQTVSGATKQSEESAVKSEEPSRKDTKKVESAEETEEPQQDAENASSYELITGLLQPGDWPEESYNVRRCTGLEVRKALLLWCRDAIYVIDGFEQTDGEGLEGKIMRVEKEHSSYNVNLRPKDFKVSDDSSDDLSNSSHSRQSGIEDKAAAKKSAQESSNEVTYQHRSQRIAFSELHSVFRRRYQLQQIALEFYDLHSNGTLIAFANSQEREEILSKVLSSPLPNSIFSSSYGTSINYKKFMASLKSKIISQWMNGKMTNFEFLMHLNSFAGRTYNDLTQYPVFPWIIADYESEELDLNDPKTYRDLSKPMGALGAERAEQFRERFEALESNCQFNEDEPPPFHYGTHYSCAAYVLYYLMRLEPFSRLALTLQGGRFDVADRLFHNIGSSWKSASEENLQDVRELIPEFFYLPDFLKNTNHFDFGTTQKGKTVHDVTLPKWAKGDPSLFIRINRQALESEYVSKNLHHWVDLVFGFKQRGEEAVNALNTFVHVTYEGEVDLESMTDPIQRESTIAQIQNFGQTPTRLERKPFPQRVVVSPLRENKIDFGSLSYLAPLTAPFCIVGTVGRCQLKRVLTESCKINVSGDKAVGDMCYVKGQLIGVGRMCALIIPQKKYYRFGGPTHGLSVHIAATSARNRELSKLVSIHDGLHRSEISVAKPSLDGQWLVTGSLDSTVRVWKYNGQTVNLLTTLCGHDGWKITCLDLSKEFGTIATGCARGQVLLWDLRSLTFVRRLRHSFKDQNDGSTGNLILPTTSVSINHKNGNVITLVGSHLSVFDINGRLLATETSLGASPSCAVATDCPEWQDNGVVAVTGHVNGEIRFWSLNYNEEKLTVKHMMVDVEHTCEITALRVTGEFRQDTLLVGDKSGKISVFKTVQLETLPYKDQADTIAEWRDYYARKPIESDDKETKGITSEETL